MKNTFYRILEESDRLDGTELIWMDTEEWKIVAEIHIGKTVGPSTVALRPVSTEAVTGSEEEIEEEFRHGLRPVHAEIREAERLNSLREHYAGLAMQGLIANPNWSSDGISPSINTWDDLGCASLQAADALIAALNKKEETV